MRAIDADHLRRWILSRVFKTQLSVVDVIDQIDREDTIEPERKTGHWLIRKFGDKARCSVCGRSFADVYDMENSDHYCRHCGSKMDGLRVKE